ncbi:hypothetical protein RF11_15188 [Thelohanellus kitauei]|uniref:Uncharacterized protein n=1 Tax=Thelohanellus kitauei TaxID=669202 RepID=A0A0C2J4D9_THEKT|nr:hypothetical protein RF11_15188 [Thelohanellus kitauei]
MTLTILKKYWNIIHQSNDLSVIERTIRFILDRFKGYLMDQYHFGDMIEMIDTQKIIKLTEQDKENKADSCFKFIKVCKELLSFHRHNRSCEFNENMGKILNGYLMLFKNQILFSQPLSFKIGCMFLNSICRDLIYFRILIHPDQTNHFCCIGARDFPYSYVELPKMMPEIFNLNRNSFVYDINLIDLLTTIQMVDDLHIKTMINTTFWSLYLNRLVYLFYNSSDHLSDTLAYEYSKTFLNILNDAHRISCQSYNFINLNLTLLRLLCLLGLTRAYQHTAMSNHRLNRMITEIFDVPYRNCVQILSNLKHVHESRIVIASLFSFLGYLFHYSSNITSEHTFITKCKRLFDFIFSTHPQTINALYWEFYERLIYKAIKFLYHLCICDRIDISDIDFMSIINCLKHISLGKLLSDHRIRLCQYSSTDLCN